MTDNTFEEAEAAAAKAAKPNTWPNYQEDFFREERKRLDSRRVAQAEADAAKAADGMSYPEAVKQARKLLFGAKWIAPRTPHEEVVLKHGTSNPDYKRVSALDDERELQISEAEKWLWRSRAVVVEPRGGTYVMRSALQAALDAESAADTGTLSGDCEPPLPTIPPEQAAPVKRWPGRPRADSRSLIEAELKKRWADGERHPDPKQTERECIAEWWRVLCDWLPKQDPNVCAPLKKTFQNTMGPIIRALQKDRAT